MIDCKNLQLTIDQIDDMRHAVGFEPEEMRKGQRHCKLFRNHFSTYGRSESWEDLISKGLAQRHEGIDNRMVYYFVSSNGLKALEYIFRVSMEVS